MEEIADSEIIQIENSLSTIVRNVGIAAVFYIMAIIFWMQGGIDHVIVIAHNFVYDEPILLKVMQSISSYGMSFIVISYACIMFMSLKKNSLSEYYPFFLLVLFSFAIAGIAGDLLKELIEKARPVEVLAGQISRTELSDTSSFPSGHATKSMALVIPFILYTIPKSRFMQFFSLIILIAGLAVCYSRIAIQAHFLSDVLAGIGTVFFSIPFAAFVVNKIYQKNKMDDKKMVFMVKRLTFIFAALAIILCFL